MKPNNNQAKIDFLVEEKKYKDYAKQHFNITFARQGNIGVVAKRIMAIVLAQIKEDDREFKSYYQMHVSDVIKDDDLTKSGSPYKLCKEALDALASQFLRIEDRKKQKYTPKHLVITAKTSEGIEYGYEKGVITVVMNPDLKDFFLQLSHYTRFSLDTYMGLKSWASQRLWEFLSAYQDTGWWYIGIDQYREIMDCQKKYVNNNKKLIEKTLQSPQTELKGTELDFTYEIVYGNSGVGRPSIIALEFHLENKKFTKIPKSWYEQSPRHNRVLNLLLSKWKISEANIIAYGKYISLDGMVKLCDDWNLKNDSSKPINDITRYCNKAFIEQGKKSKEKLKLDPDGDMETQDNPSGSKINKSSGVNKISLMEMSKAAGVKNIKETTILRDLTKEDLKRTNELAASKGYKWHKNGWYISI